MLDKLPKFQHEVGELFKAIRSESGKTISKVGLRNKAAALSKTWLDDIEPQLLQISSVDQKKVAIRTQAFRHLVKVSGPNNLKTSYLKLLNQIRKDFRDDFIIPVQVTPRTSSSGKFLDFVFEGLDANESVYLKEALDCAKSHYYRASVVLGWCAAVNRIHGKIEQIGFEKFNAASGRMALQTVGRFKKFGSRQSVNSISELRSVFDTVILWILEGMELIDSNQHARLFSCFEMRNHSAHPGEAPITEYNLASFFSDLNEIVFKNPKLKLS